MNKTPVAPVAVIGMACRLPSGIDSPEKLWEAVLHGDDVITEIPPERWDADAYYDPEQGVPGQSVSRWGGFLDDIAGFDAPFFGFGDREAAAIDPQHRLLLETSWEAIEHSGRAPMSLVGSATAVFMGLCHDDYEIITQEAGALSDAYGFPGTTASMASGRIAYWLGLRGPALTVDSACSTGLLTVHLACRSLHQGESNLALAGGSVVMLSPELNASGSALGMYSPRGRCRPFDETADGFVRAEGCAVVVLKRLADALEDGDRIFGVVRGTAVNQDGRTQSISRPSLEAQAEVAQAALAVADVDATTVGLVEAHGTGTPVGDPIEFGSLSQVYGTDGNRCALGSAKSNFGHTESAAGIIGLIKAIQSLRHGVVPPMVHFTRLPEELASIDTGLFVPEEVTPWPSRPGQALRRAAVSSYGVSGTNAHAIVEEAPVTVAEHAVATTGPLLYLLSATSTEALRTTAQRLADWVRERADQLVPSDLGYTLARRRGHRPVRTAVIAESLTELTERLQEIAEGELPYPAAVGHDDHGPVWVFSGQGSQWAAMGAELLATEPAFAEAVAEVEPLVARESGFSVTEAMSAPETVTGIGQIQPVLFTMQVALANTMRSYGVRPGAVIGHSMGEAAAAVVAGALSLEDGVRVICHRSRLLGRVAGAGAMASVELPAHKVRSELEDRGVTDVVVSVISSPQSTVIGGAPETVRDLVAGWERRDIMAREIAVDVASHSPHVDPILTDLAEELAELTPMTPAVPYYSATLDDPRLQPIFDAGYWVDNLRQPVRFAAAVQAALEDGHRVFGEPSTHPLLTRAVEQTAQSADIAVAALACMRREQPLPHGLRGFLADLHCSGAAVDFSVLYPSGRLLEAPLPTWTRRRLLITPNGDGPQWYGATTVVVHPLLGAHVRLPEEPERHGWQGDVGTAALPWLSDHNVLGVAALPGAAYCEMALAAASTVLGDDSEVRDVRFEELLLLDDETPIAAVATAAAPGLFEFEVETDLEGERSRRATAVLHAVEDEQEPTQHDLAALLAAHPNEVDGAELRQTFDSRGVRFGPAFAGLATVRTAEGEAPTLVAEISMPAAIRSQPGGYGVHPALLDACFQSVAAHPAATDVGDGGLLVPLGVARLRTCGNMKNARYSLVRVTSTARSAIEADLDVLDESGTAVLIVRGLRLGNSAGEGTNRERQVAERLMTVNWQQSTLLELPATVAGDWLLLAIDAADPLTGRVAEALKAHGGQCDSMTWTQGAEAVGARLKDGSVRGLVVIFPPLDGEPGANGLARGREHVRQMVHIARELPELLGEPPRLYVVTRCGQAVLPIDEINLEHGGLRGLLRVIGAEHPELKPTHIDVDASSDAEQVAMQLLSGSEEDETAWRDGQWYVARLSAGPLGAHERRTATVDNECDGMRLEIRTPGDLATLEFVGVDRRPPGPGEVEVAVTASSINFADVLGALGRQPSFDGRPAQLGLDFEGTISAVGPEVTDYRVGDRVGGYSGLSNGCWGTFVTTDARLVVTMPPGITEGQAAATLSVYGTAWYGLNDLARISAGDKVLIHSGTGGVGQAAIAIARWAGAEIFATAGSPQRRAILRDMGIEHVYDSRSIKFAEEIRRDTDGYGVDIVLNSLTGAAQRAGLELLSFGGRFVEIGKRDVYRNTRLGLFPFRRNLSFYCVDLALTGQTHPQRLQDLTQRVFQLIADGELPVLPFTYYPLTEAATAIRVMSAAEHTGKLLLSVPRNKHSTVVVQPDRARPFRRDGSYIITGGLGGLGLFLAALMAKAGCGRIVLAGRSKPNPKAEHTISRLRAAGADIQLVCGDIAEQETAGKLVEAATATGLPLRGVLHGAAVVEDATLTNITDELIDRDWAPKVYGAWHLHNATADQPLDWFCSFSSAAAMLGSPGQGAYAAANSWLDVFTKWQHSQGLPATAIAWGAWAQIGRGAFLAEGGTEMIAPQEGAHIFQMLLRYDRPVSGYVPIAGTPWFTALVARSPFAEAFKTAAAQRHDTAAVRAELRALPPDEWPTRLGRLLAEEAGLILRRAVDPDRPFPDHGLDSLGNLELRTRIETETGIRITPKAIATHNTVRALARHLSEVLTAEETAATAS